MDIGQDEHIEKCSLQEMISDISACATSVKVPKLKSGCSQVSSPTHGAAVQEDYAFQPNHTKVAASRNIPASPMKGFLAAS